MTEHLFDLINRVEERQISHVGVVRRPYKEFDVHGKLIREVDNTFICQIDRSIWPCLMAILFSETKLLAAELRHREEELDRILDEATTEAHWCATHEAQEVDIVKLTKIIYPEHEI